MPDGSRDVATSFLQIYVNSYDMTCPVESCGLEQKKRCMQQKRCMISV